MNAWYLDALDARGGLAFASCRKPDLASDQLDLGAPTVFVAPPAFRPETISDRTIALAAARGAFQLGLVAGEAEVAFLTLDAVTEFVRRLYLSSGGSEGLNGGGPGVPPPDGGDAPDYAAGIDRPPPEGPGGAAMTLAYIAAAMTEATHRLYFEPGQPLATFDTSDMLPVLTSPADGWTALEELARAAALLLAELAGRRPFVGNAEELAIWLRASRRLGEAVSAAGLWQPLIDHHWPLLTSIGRGIVKGAPDLLAGAYAFPGMWPPESDESMIAAAIWVFGSRRGPAGMVSAFAIAMNRWRGDEGQQSTPGDLVDDLSLWPVPRAIADHAGFDSRSISLFELLMLALGSPSIMGTGDQLDRDLAGLVLFAALYMTSASSNLDHLQLAAGNVRTAVFSLRIAEAMDWVRHQLPRTLFPPPIETLIRAASGYRYSLPAHAGPSRFAM